MSILQGFEAVNPVGPTGKSVLTVTPRYIRFNKNAVLELDSPRYVEFLVNQGTRQVAIKACDADDPKAVEFVNPKKHTASVTITSPIVLNAVLQFFDFPEVAEYQVAYAQLPGTPFAPTSAPSSSTSRAPRRASCASAGARRRASTRR